jgi:hypothetical protein
LFVSSLPVSFACYLLVFVPVELQLAIFLHNKVFVTTVCVILPVVFVVILIMGTRFNYLLEFIHYSVADIAVEFLIKYVDQQA